MRMTEISLIPPLNPGGNCIEQDDLHPTVQLQQMPIMSGDLRFDLFPVKPPTPATISYAGPIHAMLAVQFQHILHRARWPGALLKQRLPAPIIPASAPAFRPDSRIGDYGFRVQFMKPAERGVIVMRTCIGHGVGK